MSGIKIDLDDFENTFWYWDKPDWKNNTKVHDWRNYVSEEIELIWDTFSDVQKYFIYKNAENEASNEEWY